MEATRKACLLSQYWKYHFNLRGRKDKSTMKLISAFVAFALCAATAALGKKVDNKVRTVALQFLSFTVGLH